MGQIRGQNQGLQVENRESRKDIDILVAKIESGGEGELRKDIEILVQKLEECE